MASGNYPLSPCSSEGSKLADIIERLNGWYDNCAPYPDEYQFDNAATDGMYIAYIEMAIDMLERCIDKESK